jgi:release factor glutamine methyltransferase
VHTVKSALEEAFVTIERIDAQILMAHALGVDRAWLLANPMRILTETEDARVDMLVAQRALGQPVAYLVGRREFYGRDFAVGPEVLIPRPETETLVETALECLPRPRGNGYPWSILDLGTGSGAIAVTLACERPDVRIVATDASAEALDVARRNAQAHGCAERIEFAHGSWYEAVPGRRFDLVVANPPYVASGDAHLADGDLRFEPGGALTDGSPDGLDSIRAIVAGAREHIAEEGMLLFEHGYDQGDAVARLLAAAGFASTVSVKDLAGIPRVSGGKIDGA